jgi:predicted RNA-binding protein
MALNINRGDEQLLRRDEWVEAQAIQGSPELIFNSPIINKAQERILDQFTPTHPIAFVSWCTSTRPYSKSPKWKMFEKELAEVDFLVASNAGVIPMAYESSYPYLTYDAHHQPEFDEFFIIYMTRFFIRFFTLKHYDYLVINSSPTERGRKRKSSILAGRYLQQRKHIKDYAVVPSPEVYAAIKYDNIRHRMFPDIQPPVLGQIKETIEKFKQ